MAFGGPACSLHIPAFCLLQQWVSANIKNIVTSLGSGECGRELTSSGKQRSMGGEELWNLVEEKERK